MSTKIEGFPCYYTTADGTRAGRASEAFRDEGEAASEAVTQNERAKSAKLKVRYTLATALGEKTPKGINLLPE